MAQAVGCSRRTAERMRDAVEAAFAPLDVNDDGRKRRFRLVLRGFREFAAAPSAEELAELENAARALELREPGRAALLRSLSAKIGASLARSRPAASCRRRRGATCGGGLRLPGRPAPARRSRSAQNLARGAARRPDG